jgi:PKD repeat protein
MSLWNRRIRHHFRPSVTTLEDRALLAPITPISITSALLASEFDFSTANNSPWVGITPVQTPVNGTGYLGNTLQSSTIQAIPNGPFDGDVLYTYHVESFEGIPGAISAVAFPFAGAVVAAYQITDATGNSGVAVTPGTVDLTNGVVTWSWPTNLTGDATSGTIAFVTSNPATMAADTTVSDTAPLMTGPGWSARVFSPSSPPVLAPYGSGGTGKVGDAVPFLAQVTATGSSANASTLNYSWKFGDGTTTSGLGSYVVFHTYTTPGAYQVTVTATDSSGTVSAPVTEDVTIVPAASTGPLPMITTMTDTIPDFGAFPTVTSVASGPWSDPTTWSGGAVPKAGAIVAITAGTTVVFDLANSPTITTIEVRNGGDLNFDTTSSHTLTVGTLEVLQGGCFCIGTPGAPIAPNLTDQVVFADQPIDPVADPQAWGTGLIDFGMVNLEGAPKTSEVTVATAPLTGDTVLHLANPVLGWMPGDRLILPDTRQLDADQWGSGYSPEWESATVASVSADGLAVTLTAPLQFDHQGATDTAGTLRYLPQVMDMTRNVTLSSANPNGTRGHTLFTAMANADVRYVGFDNLGRTTDAPIGATNPAGRYALHIHHLMIPMDPTANGYNFTLIGNAIDNGDATISNSAGFGPEWGLVVHGSNNGLIEGNDIYNIDGAGLVTQDGTETGNVFDGNMVVRVAGLGGRPDYYTATNGGEAREGSAFWFASPGNVVTNNFASDAIGPTGEGNGFMIFCLSDANDTPILQFSGNTVYGATLQGMEYWYIGSAGNTLQDIGPSVIQNLTEWHVTKYGIYPYPSNNVTIEGFTFLDDPSLRDSPNPIGIFGSDYRWGSTTIDRADIEGASYGIIPSVNTAGTTITIENSYLANTIDDIQIDTFWTDSGVANAPYINPRTTLLINDKFETNAIQPQNTIDMLYPNGIGGGGIESLVTPDTVLVTNYNSVAGDDFKVFYNQQVPGFIVPQSILYSDGSAEVLGSPVAGLTNAENWARYGVAIAGSVAPANATTMAGILGLVSPILPS